MQPKSPHQESNVAGGDIAGRDIIHQNSYNLKPPSTLRELAAKLRLQDESEAQSVFVSQLQHYAQPLSPSPTRDLEQKLQAAKRTDLLFDGLRWKEQFAKKLTRLQFSLHAQELFVHILSKIHTYFVLNVRPKTIEGAPRSEVDALVYQLICELYEEVGNSELGLTMTDLHGMVYFLAGNCHIDWN